MTENTAPPPESPLPGPLAVNGWSIYAHPLFLDQLEGLIEEVEARKARDPETWHQKNAAKRLAAIFKLVTEVIPRDPAAPAFRLGASLGMARRHWFRAKFFQQYRLFFRFDSASRVIVFAWVNDERTRRAYGSKTDAYAIFKGMLDDGNPPEDFEALRQTAEATARRFAQVMTRR